MRKYLLTFLDKEIEEKYQFQLRQVQFPIFSWASLINTLYVILNFSESLSPENLEINIMQLCSAIIFIVMLFVICKYRKRVSTGLFLLSLISIIGQFRVPYIKKDEECLTSANIIAIYIIILFALEFKYAVTSNLLMMIIRQFQVFYYSDAKYMLIISVSSLHLCIMICSYFKERSFRTSFLSASNNELLEKTFAILSENPFFVFQFDQEQISFKLKDQHKLIGQGIPSDFNHFLRFSKYNQESLELYLFKKIQNQQLQDCEKIIKHKFDVEYEKRMYQVKIVEIFLSCQTYFLTISNPKKLINQVQIQKKYSQMFRMIYRFSYSQEKLLQNYCTYYRSRFAIQKMRRFYFQIACQSRIQIQCFTTQSKIKLINFGNVVKYILTLFSNIKLVTNEQQSIIQIDIVKLYFYLIQLFNFYESGEMLKAEIKNESGYVHLILHSQYKQFKNTYFEKIQNLLVMEVIQDFESKYKLNLETIFIFNSQWEPPFMENQRQY